MARTISAFVTLMALFFCGSALATDRYVDGTSGSDGNTPCDTPATACKTIGTAVSESAAGDTVHVGAGTYTQSVSVQDTINFVGAGSGSDAATNTVVTGNASFALRLLEGGSVTGMRLVGANAADGIALVLRSTAAGTPRTYAISDVVAIGGTNVAAPAPAVAVDDAGAAGAEIVATFDHVTATAVFWPQPIVAIAGPNVSARFSNSMIDVPIVAYGMRVQGGASVVLSHSEVVGHELAPSSQSGVAVLVANAGSEITIDHSKVLGPTGGVWIQNGGSGVIRDSLIAQVRALNYPSDNAAIFISENSGQAAHADITGSTVVSHGPNANAALRVQVVPAGGTPSAIVRNSVLRNTNTTSGTDADVFANAAFAGGTATVTADHSAFTTVLAQGVGTATATATGTAGNIAGDPLFTDPTGNFTLQPGSPLIDGGDAALITGGETDLLGSPRSLDGNRDCVVAPDIGAYEITGNALATCPPAQDSGGDAGGNPGGDPGTGTPVAPQRAATDTTAPLLGKATFASRRFAVAKRATALTARVKRGSSLRFTLSERSDVTIVIQRRVGRRWRKVATLLRKGVRAGNVKVPFSGRIRKRALKPGRYRALVTAKDGAGDRSAKKTAAFAIIRT